MASRRRKLPRLLSLLLCDSVGTVDATGQLHYRGVTDTWILVASFIDDVNDRQVTFEEPVGILIDLRLVSDGARGTFDVRFSIRPPESDPVDIGGRKVTFTADDDVQRVSVPWLFVEATTGTVWFEARVEGALVGRAPLSIQLDLTLQRGAPRLDA